MNLLDELSWRERHSFAFLVGAVPALLVGGLIGCGAYGIDTGSDSLSAVLLRGMCCAIFPVIMACVFPTAWFLPGLVYAFSFSVGYTVVAGARHGFAVLIDSTVLLFTGESHMRTETASAGTGLPWILGIAFWLAGLASILRRSRRFAALIRRLEIRDD